LVHAVGAAIDVMPVGARFAESIVQLPTKLPPIVYLNILSVEASFTTHRCTPSVTTSLGLELSLFKRKLEAANWLPDVRLAAPA
jgi:hypothetical protein